MFVYQNFCQPNALIWPAIENLDSIKKCFCTAHFNLNIYLLKETFLYNVITNTARSAHCQYVSKFVQNSAVPTPDLYIVQSATACLDQDKACLHQDTHYAYLSVSGLLYMHANKTCLCLDTYHAYLSVSESKYMQIHHDTGLSACIWSKIHADTYWFIWQYLCIFKHSSWKETYFTIWTTA